MSALLEQLAGGDAASHAESWRYSRQALRALEQEQFAAAPAFAGDLPHDCVARFDWPQTRGRRLVFVNGVLAHADTPAAASLRIIDVAPRRVHIVVSGDAASLHLVHVHLPGAQAMQWQAQHEIRVERGSVDLIEHHVGAAGATVLAALVDEAEVLDGAALRVTTLTDLPPNIALYRRSRLDVRARGHGALAHLLLGGRMQRVELDVALAGADATLDSRGSFALRGREHLDVHLQVRHAARDTRSAIAWRGVADQRARGILHGAIRVEPGADGADAQLQTHNLLLSAHAEIDAQPVLEIYADEVKASHGATVGKLDERALFYLRARGLPQALARNLLIGAFCRQAFEALQDDALRNRLDAVLSEHLPQGLVE